MAADQSNLLVTVPAGADLSAKQFYCADIDNTGSAVVQTSAGGRVVGVIYNNPTSGQACALAVTGKVKVMAGAAIATIGSSVKVDATGRVIAVSAGDVAGDLAFGVTLQAASGAGSIIEVLLTLGATV